MPLPVKGGGVAGIGEQFSDGVFPGTQAIRFTGRGDFLSPGPNRQPPGHQGGPSRSTLILHVKIGEPHPLSCEGVDPRRLDRASLDADVAPAPIVNQDVNNVWLLSRDTARDENRERSYESIESDGKLFHALVFQSELKCSLKV